jgi:hypothetical protein
MPIARVAVIRRITADLPRIAARLVGDNLKRAGDLAHFVGTLSAGCRPIQHGAGSQIEDRAMTRAGYFIAAYLAVT